MLSWSLCCSVWIVVFVDCCCYQTELFTVCGLGMASVVVSLRPALFFCCAFLHQNSHELYFVQLFFFCIWVGEKYGYLSLRLLLFLSFGLRVRFSLNKLKSKSRVKFLSIKQHQLVIILNILHKHAK